MLHFNLIKKIKKEVFFFILKYFLHFQKLLRSESLRSESLRSESLRSESLRSESLRSELLRSELLRSESLRSELLHSVLLSSELLSSELLRRELLLHHFLFLQYFLSKEKFDPFPLCNHVCPNYTSIFFYNKMLDQLLISEVAKPVVNRKLLLIFYCYFLKLPFPI